MDTDWLLQLCRYWASDFDWPAQVARLRAVPQVVVDIEGVRVHAVHARARDGRGIPLVLTHGWPSAFSEYLPVVDMLTDPAAFGMSGPAFDVVVPSLPGYAFSTRPDRPMPYREVAGLWHNLMAALGYSRYGTGGADFGSGVATMMALSRPDAVLGVHLSTLELDPYTGPGSAPLSRAERDWTERSAAWWSTEGGYKAIQSTRPATLAYALTDSPAGLAAWIGEKWHAWADPRTDWTGPVRDALLTVLTLYWLTGTIGTTLLDYYDNRVTPPDMGRDDWVRVPTAVARFSDPAGFSDPVGFSDPAGGAPREWYERLYRVERWTPMPAGGHFAAAEQPRLLAGDIAAFFGGLISR